MTTIWNQADAQGHLIPGVHRTRAADTREILDAINRRLNLTYHDGINLPEVDGGRFVQCDTINCLRSVIMNILSPNCGTLGGDPPSPAAMQWLWPVDDGDENKVIVAGAPAAGEVNLLGKINQTTVWTDPSLTGGHTPLRAVHWNELRHAIEVLRRGRWEFPIYFAAGILSLLPDATWMVEAIANNGADELRSLGFFTPQSGDSPTLGLTQLTVRPSSRIEITADLGCDIQLSHILRPVDFVDDRPTWNSYSAGNGLNWSLAGALGEGDARFMGSAPLAAQTPVQITGPDVTSALQAIADGQVPNFLVRRSDTGDETVQISGKAIIEFDLDIPPN